MRTALFAAAAAIAVASSSCAAERIAGIRNLVNNVQRLTGPDITGDPYDIGGTDIGVPIYHNSRMYLLFGDTFSGEDTSVGGNWRRNTVAWSFDTNPSDGITIADWATNPATGQAKQTYSNYLQVTNIPTGGISVNGSLYAWFMHVTYWGSAGSWTISKAELARWNETTTSFNVVSNFTFAGDGNFGMVAAREGVNGDPYIYLWGTPSGRFGKVKLARFLPADIENRSAYRFYNGTVGGVPQWTSDEYAANYVVNAAVGEMSVMYNEAIGTWTMLYFDEVNDKFQIRQAYDPWGPWSSPVTVMTKWQGPSGTFGLYAPYMHPQWVENGGRTIYFTYSLWEPYDVYLAKVTLDTPPTGSTIINDGALCTNSRSVSLSLPAADDSGTVYQMRISSDGVFDTESWEPYTPSKTYTIPAGDGAKTVYVRFRDASQYESETSSDSIILDTQPPTIRATSISPEMVAEGSTVRVSVEATDANGVGSVIADLNTFLTTTGGILWEGDVPAGSLGAHLIRIDATDTAGNTATHYLNGYTTVPMVAASVRALLGPVTAAASTNYLFKACGKVTFVSPGVFDLDDGSALIRVIATGCSGIADNDYITVIGSLTAGSSPTLTVQPSQIRRIGP